MFFDVPEQKWVVQNTEHFDDYSAGIVGAIEPGDETKSYEDWKVALTEFFSNSENCMAANVIAGFAEAVSFFEEVS